MKTAETTAKTTQNANAKNNNAPRTENRPNITGKEAKQDETANDEQPAQAAPFTAAPTAEAAPVSALAVGDQPAYTAPAAQEQQVTEEATKGEIKYIKPALNLEQTIKTVGHLHKLTIQRLTLIARIKTLEEFEIMQEDDMDELEDNPWRGCKLSIKDPKGREFFTNTGNLIREVVNDLNKRCLEKLAEIEAEIVFPTTR